MCGYFFDLNKPNKGTQTHKFIYIRNLLLPDYKSETLKPLHVVFDGSNKTPWCMSKMQNKFQLFIENSELASKRDLFCSSLRIRWKK